MDRKTLRRTSGFTLIELLVVIAIIGILSAVVLASLNTARGRAADAAVRSNLSNARAEAELFNAVNGSYLGVCTGTSTTHGILDNVQAAANAGSGSPVCNVTPTTGAAWAASASLNSAGHWCVDSNGASKQITNALASSTYACPAS